MLSKLQLKPDASYIASSCRLFGNGIGHSGKAIGAMTDKFLSVASLIVLA
jgi:hypothetical protein